MSDYKALKRIMECVRHCDNLFELVQLRSYAAKYRFIAMREGDEYEYIWNNALYHATQVEIVRRKKSGSI